MNYRKVDAYGVSTTPLEADGEDLPPLVYVGGFDLLKWERFAKLTQADEEAMPPLVFKGRFEQFAKPTEADEEAMSPVVFKGCFDLFKGERFALLYYPFFPKYL